jgi:hypothetical protein
VSTDVLPGWLGARDNKLSHWRAQAWVARSCGRNVSMMHEAMALLE